MATVVLRSLLSLEECVNRLAEAVERDTWLRSESRPAVYSLAGRRLELRKRPLWHNSAQSYLIGSFEDQDGGTVFRGTVGPHPDAVLGLQIWFCLVTLFWLVILVALAAGSVRDEARLPALVIPPAILGFGYGLSRFTRWMAAGTTASSLRFLGA